MKVTTLAALLLAYCILVACTRTSPNAQLVQADSLMQKSPDSALHFLEKIYPEKLKSLEDFSLPYPMLKKLLTIS